MQANERTDGPSTQFDYFLIIGLTVQRSASIARTTTAMETRNVPKMAERVGETLEKAKVRT